MTSPWIKVTDSLPENHYDSHHFAFMSKVVLVRLNTGHATTAFLYQGEDEKVDPLKWYENCSDRWDLNRDVTHWMPIPEFKEYS